MKIRSVRTSRFIALLLAALGASAMTASAQQLYRLTFKGTCSSLDANGNSVDQPINTQTLVREFASLAQATNFNDLQLVFSLNNDPNGDAIEVVNKKNGSFVAPVFPLEFPESASVATPKGVTQRRFAYVYNIYQPGYSRGTALMNERFSITKTGRTNRFVMDGEMQWYELPTNSTNGLRICTGKFSVGGPVKVK